MDTPRKPVSAAKRSRTLMIIDFLRSSVLYWLPVLLFVGLANNVTGGTHLPGDLAILRWFNQNSTTGLDHFMLFVTHFGSAVFVIPALAATILALYYRGLRKQAWFVLFSIGGTGAINLLFKLLFERSRPSLWEQIVQENGYSFPSGHAMISSAAALTAIALLWHTSYRFAAIITGTVFFLLVSVSRLYLGVHYPSDIVAGWIMSLLWVAILYRIFNRSTPGTSTIPPGQNAHPSHKES